MKFFIFYTNYLSLVLCILGSFFNVIKSHSFVFCCKSCSPFLKHKLSKLKCISKCFYNKNIYFISRICVLWVFQEDVADSLYSIPDLQLGKESSKIILQYVGYITRRNFYNLELIVHQIKVGGKCLQRHFLSQFPKWFI